MVRVPAESKPRDDKPIAAQSLTTSQSRPTTPDFSSIVAALFEQDAFFDIDDDDHWEPASEFLGWLDAAADSDMAPPRQNLLPKDRFALAFGSLKTQTYHDPAARAPGSHTYVSVVESSGVDCC